MLLVVVGAGILIGVMAAIGLLVGLHLSHALAGEIRDDGTRNTSTKASDPFPAPPRVAISPRSPQEGV